MLAESWLVSALLRPLLLAALVVAVEMVMMGSGAGMGRCVLTPDAVAREERWPWTPSVRLLLYVLPLTDRKLEYVDFCVVFRPRFASGRAVSSSSDQWDRILSAIGEVVTGGEVEIGGEGMDGRVRV